MIQKNVIFIDETDTSSYNGIGTFRDLMLKNLSNHNIKVYLVSFSTQSNIPDPVPNDGDLIHFRFSFTTSNEWRDRGLSIFNKLIDYLQDSPSNVFVINHSPCSTFLEDLKTYYPTSKIIFIVHDQSWCSVEGCTPHIFSKLMREYHEYEAKGFNYPCILTEAISEEIKIYDMVDTIVSLSKATYAILLQDYRITPSKVIYIPNGISYKKMHNTLKISKNELDLPPQTKLLLYAGRLTKSKGIERLIPAVQYLKKLYPDIKLCLIGQPSNTVYFNKIQVTNKDFLILHRWLSKRELKKWYDVADVGIIPSYSEQCSFVALEMMRAGLPIVTTDANGLKEIFKDGENAYIAQLGDNKSFEVSLQRAIDKALQINTRTLNKFNKYNWDLLQSSYSLNKMIASYRDIITKI